MAWTRKTHVASSMVQEGVKTALFIGRWQPLHEGHKAMFQEALNEGKNIVIAVRDTKVSDANPYTTTYVINNIVETYILPNNLTDRVAVMAIPDIQSVEFGRGVGYDIIERIPPFEIAKISATKIRDEQRKSKLKDNG